MFLTYRISYGRGYGDNTSDHFISQTLEEAHQGVEDYLKSLEKIYEGEKNVLKSFGTKEVKGAIIRGYKMFDGRYFDIKTIVLKQ